MSIEIKNQDKANFTITVFFNDEKSDKNTYNISSNKNFTIKKDDWKNICNEKIFACGVSFGVYLESKRNATFEITAGTTYIPGKQNNETDGNNKAANGDKILKLCLFIGGGVLVLLIIIMVIVRVCKNKGNDEQLEKDVNNSSFGNGRLIELNEN